MSGDFRLKYVDGQPRQDTFNVSTLTSNASGNTTIATPGSGKAIRLFYVCLNADGGNVADVTASVRFGASGVLLYKMSLKAGSIFARNIGAGLNYIQGQPGEDLILNLSGAQTVNATVEWEEVVS